MTPNVAIETQVAAALQAVLMRSEIEIKTDRAGRQFAQYYSRAARRWIRVPLADAQIILAERAVSQ